MEKVQAIMYIVFASVGVLAYIVTTILAIKRKKAKGENVNADEALATIASNVIELVKTAEHSFETMNKGGYQKLKDVLNDTKDLCANAGIVFDKGYWTEFINKAVDLINIDRKPAETSTEKSAEAK